HGDAILAYELLEMHLEAQLRDGPEMRRRVVVRDGHEIDRRRPFGPGLLDRREDLRFTLQTMRDVVLEQIARPIDRIGMRGQRDDAVERREALELTQGHLHGAVAW